MFTKDARDVRPVMVRWAAGSSPRALDAVCGCSQRRAGQAAHMRCLGCAAGGGHGFAQLADARCDHALADYWYGLLDEDQVSALSDAGGWVALQDRYVHRACRLLVIL